MIEKLDIKDYKDKEQLVWFGIINKINEIIDIMNAITIDVDGTKCVDGSENPNSRIDAAVIATLRKENSDLKDEVETLKKQLGIATESLNSVHYSLINPDAPINTIYQMKDRAKEALDEIMELDNE